MSSRKGNHFMFKMPSRFDLAISKEKVGYIALIKEINNKNNKVIKNDGTPYSIPKEYYIHWLNAKHETYSETQIYDLVNKSDKLKQVTFEENSLVDQSSDFLYGIGDLLVNKKSNKLFLIIETVSDSSIDFETSLHSKFWYKIQCPGQQWEPISQTMIINLKEKGIFDIHKKKKDLLE